MKMINILILTLLAVLPYLASSSAIDVANISNQAHDPELLAALKTWDNYQMCHHLYFGANQDNLERSGANEFYTEFVDDAAQTDTDEYIKKGEAKYFGWKNWNDFEFECGSLQRDSGCSRMPRCEEIVVHTLRTFPEMAMADVLDRSRKVLFSAIQINMFSKDMNYAHSLMSQVQSNLIGRAATIVYQFSLQPDYDADAACQLVHGVIEQARSVFFWYIDNQLNIAKSQFGEVGKYATKFWEVAKEVIANIPKMFPPTKSFEYASYNRLDMGTEMLISPDGSINPDLWEVVQYVRREVEGDDYQRHSPPTSFVLAARGQPRKSSDAPSEALVSKLIRLDQSKHHRRSADGLRSHVSRGLESSAMQKGKDFLKKELAKAAAGLEMAPEELLDMIVSGAETAARAGYNIIRLGFDYMKAIKGLETSTPGIGVPGLASPSVAGGMCAAFGGGIADQNLERQRVITRWMVDQGMRVRYQLSAQVAQIMGGTIYWKQENDVLHVKPYSVLSMVLKNIVFPEDGKFVAPPNKEMMVTKTFTETMLTGLWRNAKCYVKCQPANDNVCNSDILNIQNKNRFCRDGWTCQNQCWSTARTGNHETKLIGRDYLHEWDYTVRDPTQDSLQNWALQGNTETGLPVGKWVDAIKKYRHVSHFTLPVCKTEQRVSMGDFNDVRMQYPKDRNTAFPCTCGNWQSNDTAQFLQMIGMNTDQVDKRNTAYQDTMRSVCPRNLRDLPPFNNYLAFCELGIRFAKKSDADGFHIHSHQKSWWCDNMKRNLASNPNISEFEANDWFCRDPDAQRIYQDESNLVHIKGKVQSLHKVRNHRDRCKAWRDGERFGL